MKKKSIKKHIKVGSIIKPNGNDYFYKVTELKERLFECELITHDEDWMGHKQEFYYNIEMSVYGFVDSNYL